MASLLAEDICSPIQALLVWRTSRSTDRNPDQQIQRKACDIMDVVEAHM